MIALLALLLAAPVAAAGPLVGLLPDGIMVEAPEAVRYWVTPERQVLPVDGLLLFHPPAQSAIVPLIDAPDRTVQGRAVTALVASMDPVDSLTAVLREPGGAWAARVRAFELPYVHRPSGPPAFPPGPLPIGPPQAPVRARVYALILGVPAEAPKGVWRMEIDGRSGSRAFAYARTLEVTDGGYPQQRIRLDPRLTALRTRSDARTAQEQARLTRAIQSFTTEGVPSLDPWVSPVARAVRSGGFGDRRTYLYSGGATAGSVHRGLDLAAPAGTPVRATATGRVVLAEELVVSGNTVAVESLPGVVTLFYHLSSMQVAAGEHVERGQIVGRVGATGLATGAHLHWELRVSGVAVKPNAQPALVDKPSVFRIIVDCETQYHQRR